MIVLKLLIALAELTEAPFLKGAQSTAAISIVIGNVLAEAHVAEEALIEPHPEARTLTSSRTLDSYDLIARFMAGLNSITVVCRSCD